MTPVPAEDTIVAVATAAGRGALAIVRLSGPQALEIARPLIRHWPAAPRRVSLSEILDVNGELLDTAVVVYYEAPASFTGENAVEITCHGGSIAAATIVAAIVAAGARPADGGEFTRRAVLNGKLDLLQAEAIGDLIDAATRPAQRVALAQLDGGLSRRISALREHILALEALSAYDIDFPEEDDGPVPAARIATGARDVLAELDLLLATAPVGEIVRAGAVVVIAGAPNVGKSSLFNAMLGRRRAIVTDVPGTTRDALEAVIEADGWPVRLVDTAGLRETSETVERLGIEVSHEYLGRADVVLACGDSSSAIANARNAAASASHAPVIAVRTKSDLLPQAVDEQEPDGALLVSAETGDGLRELSAAISHCLEAAHGALSIDAPLITREHQRVDLERARAEMRAFSDAWDARSLPAVVAAIHLREATRHLEQMIGTVDVEDVLDRVFSSFCVGK